MKIYYAVEFKDGYMAPSNRTTAAYHQLGASGIQNEYASFLGSDYVRVVKVTEEIVGENNNEPDARI
jgi:hypothetical protein